MTETERLKSTVPIGIHRYVLMKRFMLSITEEMERTLELERKRRMLSSIPETTRVIIGEYLSMQGEHESNKFEVGRRSRVTKQLAGYKRKGNS